MASPGAPIWDTTAAIPSATREGSSANASRPTGTIFERVLRPRPQAVRRLWVAERDDRAAPPEPRSPVPAVAEVVDAARGAGVAHRVGASGALGHAARSPTPSSTRGRPARALVGRALAEQVLQAAASGLEPDEREVEIDDGVADQVVRSVRQRDEDLAAVDDDLRASGSEGRGQPVGALVDLDREGPGVLRERPERRGTEQPAGVDGHEEVADPLDLPEQVAGHDDRDPELGAGAAHQVEHLVATGRIEPVRRLVEQEQAWVVDERLGQLDALLHAGRVAAHRAIALLE